MASPRPEALADALFGSALDCIIVADTAGRIVEFNPAAERVFGWSRAEILGQTMEQTFIPPIHRHAHHVGMVRYLAHRQARVIGKRLHLTALRRDGSEFRVELTITETSVDGVIYFVAHMRDIETETRARQEAEQSRSVLQSFIDNAPLPMALNDLDGRALMVNQVCATLYGLSVPGFLDADFTAVQARWVDYDAVIRPAVEEVIATGETRRVTTRFDAGNGSGIATMAMSIFPLFDADGAIVSIGSVGFDLTDLEKARTELEEAKALFEAFIQNAPNPMALMDPSGRQLMVNHAAARYYDQTPEALVAGGPDMINPPVLQTGITAMLGRVATNLVAEQTDTAFRMPSGEIRELAFSFFPILGPDGKIAYIGNITFDLTEERRAKAALQTLQSQLLALFNHAPAGMYVKDVAGPVIFCSPSMASSVGRTQAEMVGLTEDQFLNPDFLADLRAIDARIIESREPFTREALNPLTGTYQLGSRFPILNEAGEVVQIGGMVIDIDERVRAQQALDETRAQLQAFMENSPIAMSLADREGRLVMINKAGAAYFGRTPAEMVALPPEETLSAWVEMDTVIRPTARRIVQSKSTEIFETMLHSTVDETMHRILLTMFPVLDRQGEVALIGGASIDITAMRDAQDALARSKEALHQSEKLAALGQLLAGVAHELNNPLSIVRGRSELLEEQLAGTPYAVSLRKLTEAADRCARIVKAFLAMARQTGPQRVMSHVNDLVEIAMDLANHGLRSAGVTVLTDLATDIPEIEMDDDQIVQVLLNLVLNAQHALETAGTPRTLTIRTRFDGAAQTVGIDVADNGPGIAADIAPRVFDPFFTTKAVGRGTGLGLSVCKGIVEAHDGSFTLHETPGGGATFSVRLPARRGGTNPVDQPAPLPPARGHILIVDDEADVADLLADCLAPIGFQCVVAGSGEAALALLESRDFDVIFSDVRMPGMDGLALYDRIAATRPALASRFVFISGDVLHRNFRGIAGKGLPVVEKPFNARVVRETAIAIIAEGELQ